MPHTDVVFYAEGDGRAPVVEWLKELRNLDEIAYGRCAAAIARLATLGHELRRPLADILRNGVYEQLGAGGSTFEFCTSFTAGVWPYSPMH